MPFDRTKYPSHWESFSKWVRGERAGWRCECTGECGKCKGWRCGSAQGENIAGKRGPWRVVLTVAHLNQAGGPCQCDPRCADPTHVKAMCQACHLRMDRPRHIRNRRENRRAKLAARDLFD